MEGAKTPTYHRRVPVPGTRTLLVLSLTVLQGSLHTWPSWITRSYVKLALVNTLAKRNALYEPVRCHFQALGASSYYLSHSYFT